MVSGRSPQKPEGQEDERARQKYFSDRRRQEPGEVQRRDERRSGEIAGGMNAGSENPAAASSKDGGGGTSDKFSTRTIEVVNAHSWSVFAKLAKHRLEGREPTKMIA